jgi:hypothetical protein
VIWRSAAALAVLGLQACATLDESQCRSVDWYELGHRDGASGYSSSRLDSHGEACGEFGLAVDRERWRAGYEGGLLDYCVVDNGYRVGRQGGHYARVCPAELEPEFLAAFELGSETAQVESELNTLLARIDSLESRLGNSKLDDETRSHIRRELRELDRQARSLRRSRDRLEDEWRYRFSDRFRGP